MIKTTANKVENSGLSKNLTVMPAMTDSKESLCFVDAQATLKFPKPENNIKPRG